MFTTIYVRVVLHTTMWNC